jgi:hypothetical protein
MHLSGMVTQDPQAATALVERRKIAEPDECFHPIQRKNSSHVDWRKLLISTNGEHLEAFMLGDAHY